MLGGVGAGLVVVIASVLVLADVIRADPSRTHRPRTHRRRAAVPAAPPVVSERVAVAVAAETASILEALAQVEPDVGPRWTRRIGAGLVLMTLTLLVAGGVGLGIYRLLAR